MVARFLWTWLQSVWLRRLTFLRSFLLKVKRPKRILLTSLACCLLTFALSGCSDRIEASSPFPVEETLPYQTDSNLKEVAPPQVIQELKQGLSQYQPQVQILSPRPDEVIQDVKVAVKLDVQNLPIFKDSATNMGPHLHLILDNQPYQAVYDLSKPVIFEDLQPGTHTLRVFASRPWHESFKNRGAYAQTTFHLITKTEENTPDPALPLLTYSRPKGTYGAEPIMLDFYLTNAPLHLVATETPEDEIADWRVKVTINGQSFLLEDWQPIYLEGFEKGKNWIKLEYIDETGKEIKNNFNRTVRLIRYEPKGDDTLSKMVRGEISADSLKSMIDPSYQPVMTPPVEEEDIIEEEVIEEPAPVELEPEPTVEPIKENTVPEEDTELSAPEVPEVVKETSPAPVELESVTEEEIETESLDTVPGSQAVETLEPEIMETDKAEPEILETEIQATPTMINNSVEETAPSISQPEEALEEEETTPIELNLPSMLQPSPTPEESSTEQSVTPQESNLESEENGIHVDNWVQSARQFWQNLLP